MATPPTPPTPPTAPTPPMPTDSPAEVAFTLPEIFAHGMVLQRDRPIRVWGRGPQGLFVVAELGDQRAQTAVDAQGAWRLALPAMPAGGPHRLSLSLHSSPPSSPESPSPSPHSSPESPPLVRRVFEDVLIGEVWLISGQSNAYAFLRSTEGYEETLKQADLPHLRLNHVHGWEASNATSAERFSAIGWYFGQALSQRLPGVPIGLIQRARGGTAIHSWISPQAFAADPALRAEQLDPWLYYQRVRPHLWDLLMSVTPAARPTNSLETWADHTPGVDFRQRIEPIVPYTLAGAVWYQGESNAWGFSTAQAYEHQLRALIADWRSLWDQPDLPMIIAQLPNYSVEPTPQPAQVDPWFIVQEAQARVAERTPQAGLATGLDTGGRDIHPKRKYQLARRLAAVALAKVYDQPVAHRGPTFRQISRQGRALRVDFDHAQGLRVAWERPEDQACVETIPPGVDHLGFALAGADRVFHWADEAQIQGQSVLLSSQAVPEPVAVRYAHWQSAPWSLINDAGLPAPPFRSDDWHWDLLADLPEEAWPRQAVAVRSAEPGPVDAHPDKPVWRQLQAEPEPSPIGPTVLSGLKRAHALAPAPAWTRACLRWDDESLYAAILCQNPPGHVVRAQAPADRPEELFKDDYVELLVDAQGQGKLYHRLAVNPAGTLWDAEAYAGDTIDRLPVMMGALKVARRRDPGWQSQAIVAAAVEADGSQWRAELTIPWKSLAVKAPPRDHPIGVQLVRGMADPAVCYEWTPTGRDRSTGAMMPPRLMGGVILFHSPQRFGRVKLVPADV